MSNAITSSSVNAPSKERNEGEDDGITSQETTTMKDETETTTTTTTTTGEDQTIVTADQTESSEHSRETTMTELSAQSSSGGKIPRGKDRVTATRRNYPVVAASTCTRVRKSPRTTKPGKSASTGSEGSSTVGSASQEGTDGSQGHPNASLQMAPPVHVEEEEEEMESEVTTNTTSADNKTDTTATTNVVDASTTRKSKKKKYEEKESDSSLDKSDSLTSGYIPQLLSGRTSDPDLDAAAAMSYAGAYSIDATGQPIVPGTVDEEDLQEEGNVVDVGGTTAGARNSHGTILAEAVAVPHGEEEDGVHHGRIRDLEERVQEMELKRIQDEALVRQMREREQNTVAATAVVQISQDDDPNSTTKKGEGTETSMKFCGSRKIAIAVLIVVVILAGVMAYVGVAASQDDGDGDEKVTDPGTNDTILDRDEKDTMDRLSSIPKLPPTLQRINERGYMICSESGHPFVNDLCLAIAAAIFGTDTPVEEEHVQFVLMDSLDEVWYSLASGDVDISANAVPYQMHHDVYGLSEDMPIPVTFSTPFLYAGTVFFGKPEFVDCADQGETLKGICRDLIVCVTADTTNQKVVDTLLDGSNYIEGIHPLGMDLFEGFVVDICNVVAISDIQLNEPLLMELGYEGEYKASEILHTNDPLSLVTRGDDVEFGDFVNWIIQALITAESLNITQSTADQFFKTTVFGEQYESMFVNAIKTIGNYGELFDRHLAISHPHRAGNALAGSDERGEVGSNGLLHSLPLGSTRLPLDDIPEQQQPGPTENGTLQMINNRGGLHCGVVVNGDRLGLAEYSSSAIEELMELDGNNLTTLSSSLLDKVLEHYEAHDLVGIDLDYCRGLGSVVSSTTDGVNESTTSIITYSTFEEAFMGLASKEIDVLAGAPVNIINDVKEPTTEEGSAFGPPYYYSVHSGRNSSSQDNVRCSLATREDDVQWSDFVRWMTMATIYAEEEGIVQKEASLMPVVDLFGSQYKQAFRYIIDEIGNYGEIYERNMEAFMPRADSASGFNMLNDGSHGQLNPMW